MFSEDQIFNATEEELRSMIKVTSAAYRESRAAAAHHSLQYNLLSMETSEILKRMEVELEMTQREVEVLQAAAQRVTPLLQQRETPTPSTDELLSSLRNHSQHLEAENGLLRFRLKQAKALILERESTMTEESDRLRERISENRKHINLLRHFNGTQEGLHPSALSTPCVGRSQYTLELHPSQIPGSKARGDKAFAALLLADQVLSQEGATAPSTPRRSRKTKTEGRSATYTMNDIASTPVQNRSAPNSNRIPSQHFYTSRSRVNRPTTVPQPPIATHRRHGSRDSTISASEDEGDMLPKLPTQNRSVDTHRHPERFHSPSKPVMRTPQTPKSQQIPTPKSSALIQTRIYGRITKPGMSRTEEQSKRKFRESDAVVEDHHSKRGRMEEGVGLGIGGLSNP